MEPHLTCMLTSVELHRLYRRIGHFSTYKLTNLQNRSGVDKIEQDTRRRLKTTERVCDACQRYAQKLRQFKFAFPEDKDINHTNYADERKPILHVVDEVTYFQAACWLENMTPKTFWKALRFFWIDVYAGLPVIRSHEDGKPFMGTVFQANADMLRIRTKSSPVELSQSMSIVERYHSPIIRAYNLVRKKALDMDREAVSQLAVKAVHASVRPNSLVPTLLVFGALPRLALSSHLPSPSTARRSIAPRKATNEVSKLFSSRQLRSVRKSCNGPSVTDVHTTPIGAPVLVNCT